MGGEVSLLHVLITILHNLLTFFFLNIYIYISASIIDALDTLLIMGLEVEYQEALEFVRNIDFTRSNDSSKGFETNIRYLGGLLSANDLRPDPILVQKAIEVTEATLIPLFVESTSLGVDVKVPLTYMNLNT